MNRRQFTALTTAGVAGGMLSLAHFSLASSRQEGWDPDRPPAVSGKPLKIQPILMHTTYQPREATSWRSWSRINNEQAASEEMARISREVNSLADKADFPLQVLPLVKVTSADEAAKVHTSDYDVVVVYPATGSGTVLKACLPVERHKDAIVFVRHRSGPIYYWYEALSTRYLKKTTEEEPGKNSSQDHGGVSVRDVVVDDYQDVLWRLRALYGLKNFVGQRIIALGGPQGKYDPEAPKVARERYQLDIIEVSYDDLTRRIAIARPWRICPR